MWIRNMEFRMSGVLGSRKIAIVVNKASLRILRPVIMGFRCDEGGVLGGFHLKRGDIR